VQIGTGEYRILTNGTLERSLKKVRPVQAHTAQNTLHDPRSVEIDPYEVDSTQTGTAQVWLRVKMVCAPLIRDRHALPQEGNVILIPGRDSLAPTGP
jgi:hypothetical protein